MDVHSVGAGGGSIAWLDAGGALHVGPQSAGADPGPAAYDQGGTQPTVTDAHLVLGRLRPDRFLGGQMTLKRARAQQAVAGIAGPFDGDVVAAAQAIIEVVNANIGRALRVISVERGYDPAAFALVAFGGAGPLHACELAEQLGLQRIIIPPAPGVLSASGLLHADVTRDVARGLMLRLPAAGRSLPSGLREAFTALERTARNALAADGYRRGVQFERSADLRYLGQSHELRVPLPRRLSVGIVREALEAAHRERFGHVDPSRDVEIVVARVKARVVGFRPPDGGAPPAIDRTAPKPEMARVVWDRPRPTQIIARRSVGAADVAGPAILTQLDTTILDPAGLARARRARRQSPGSEAGMTTAVPRSTKTRSIRLDPARLSVFDSLVASVAEEMGAALQHTALSPNIKERRDYSCAVFDARGEQLAQAAHIPVHLGSMPESVRAVAGQAPWQPGDIAILNDPFLGGTHLPDVTMVSPVFSAEPQGRGKRPRLVGYVASRAAPSRHRGHGARSHAGGIGVGAGGAHHSADPPLSSRRAGRGRAGAHSAQRPHTG